jgi:hypothetical protein
MTSLTSRQGALRAPGGIWSTKAGQVLGSDDE